jgi:hypothetical protein
MVMPVALAIGCGDEVREGGSADGSASINLSVGSTSDEGSSTLATNSSWDNDTNGSAATLQRLGLSRRRQGSHHPVWPGL